VSAFLLGLALVFVAAGLFLSAAYSLSRLWLDHRVRLAFLARLEKQSAPLRTPQEVQALLSTFSGEGQHPPRQDIAVTGLALGILGIGCILLGRALRIGQIAVGLYTGGWVCGVLGIIFVVFGLIARFLAHRTVRPF
jgi:hypothetical protein